MRSFAIVSMWDMLEFNVARFYRVTTMLTAIRAGTETVLQAYPQAKIEELKRSGSVQFSPDWLADLIALRSDLVSLDLPISLKSFDKYLSCISKPGAHLKESVRLLSELGGRLQDELDTRYFFRISQSDQAFLSPKESLFGDVVDGAFPSSLPEITEAAKCRALGRWTASVMHLMRALEPALLALQSAVHVNVPKEQWDQIINQIEAKIRDIRKHTHGGGDEQWYSEAASHFRIIKNAWRNHAQHLHESYDEERAIAIYDSVRSFMRHLATRLSE